MSKRWELLKSVKEGYVVWEGDDHTENPDVIRFDSYDAVVDHFLGQTGEHEIVNSEDGEIVRVKDGNVIKYMSNWGSSDSFLRRKWVDRRDDGEDYESGGCPLCGDGGCITCRPSWFL